MSTACAEIVASTSTPSTRRQLDGVAMRFLTARRSPHNPATAEVHPTSWLIPTPELAALVHERALLRPRHSDARPQAKARPAGPGIHRKFGSECRQHAGCRLQMHRLPTGKIFAALEAQVEGPYHTNMTVDQLLRDVRESRRASTSIIRPLRRGIDGTARVPDQRHVERLLASQAALVVLVVQFHDRADLLRRRPPLINLVDLQLVPGFGRGVDLVTPVPQKLSGSFCVEHTTESRAQFHVLLAFIYIPIIQREHEARPALRSHVLEHRWPPPSLLEEVRQRILDPERLERRVDHGRADGRGLADPLQDPHLLAPLLRLLALVDVRENHGVVEDHV